MDAPVGECVELDRLNMSSVLAAAGETFDAAGRAGRLAKSLATNGQLITVRRDGRLAGYIELRFADNLCAVWSIQVHPRDQGGTVLLALLRGVARAIDPSRVRVVVSAAHSGNRKSVRLHRLLGFREVGTNGQKIRFEAGVAELVTRLRGRWSRIAEPGTAHEPSRK